MKLLLTPGAAEDLDYWQANDSVFAERIRQILLKLKQGEALPSHQITHLPLALKGLSAVRISAEHRIVFERLHDDIIVHQCRFHY
jgi:toxin YoeB